MKVHDLRLKQYISIFAKADYTKITGIIRLILSSRRCYRQVQLKQAEYTLGKQLQGMVKSVVPFSVRSVKSSAFQRSRNVFIKLFHYS